MKKAGLFIFIFIVAGTAKAQDNLHTLAEKLLRHTSTDKQKVTAIFRWITDNINYNSSPQRKINPPATEEEEGPLRPLHERVAELVIRRKTAFCDGFARLFMALCEKAGLPSVIICGYAPGGLTRQPTRFGVNHYWNAVLLEGRWQLLDATWASGFINARTGEFIREFNPRYFLADPAVFILDHFPDDPRWTLLTRDHLPDEFRKSPFKQKAFGKYGFRTYSPGTGIITASVGDTVILELEAAKPLYGLIAASALTDSSFYSHSPSWVFLQPAENREEGEITTRSRYIYPITRTDVEWIYLLYNEDVVMRYKLNVRNPSYR